MHEDIMTVLTSPSTVRIRILPAVPAAVGAGPRYNELTVDQSRIRSCAVHARVPRRGTRQVIASYSFFVRFAFGSVHRHNCPCSIHARARPSPVRFQTP